MSAPVDISIIVYDSNNLTTPILLHTAASHKVTVMYGNVDKPEFRLGDATQILIPKSWDVVQVQIDTQYVAVVVRNAIR